MVSALRLVPLVSGLVAVAGANCLGNYAKCGGEGYTGITACCDPKATCQVINKWWSGCFVEDKKKCDAPVALYRQCGGKNYEGSECCADSNASCQVVNEWWSGCFIEEKCTIPIYKQCAGKNYIGSGCCAYGNTCKYINEWWSGCFPPDHNPNPTPVGCSKLYGQCGGINWDGPKCCESGSTCQVQVLNGVDNIWYSQCLPPKDTNACDHPAKLYDQCGGLNYTGPRCCEEGSTCQVQIQNGVANLWYSQCLKPAADCAAEFSQCGGKDYTGSTTCCAAGQTCKFINEWWSGCFPGVDATPPPLHNCSREWSQCGGIGWIGPTCCMEGSSCHAQILNGEVNKYYSQCLPDTPGDGGAEIQTYASKGGITEACASGDINGAVQLEYKLKLYPTTPAVTLLSKVLADPKICTGEEGTVIVQTVGHGIIPPIPLEIQIKCTPGAIKCETTLNEYAVRAAIKAVTADPKIQDYLFSQLSTVFSTYTYAGAVSAVPPPTPAPLPRDECSLPWEQCGGLYYDGPTCCVSPAVCEIQMLDGKINVYYSQCVIPPTGNNEEKSKNNRKLIAEKHVIPEGMQDAYIHTTQNKITREAPVMSQQRLDVPKHVAIIPDGSRRYGKLTGTEYPEQLRNSRAKIVDFWNWAEELGITTVTMYGLSVDNMNSRPQYELDVLYHETADGLMKLRYLLRENTRIVNVITSAESFDTFPKELQDAINIVHADCKVKIDKAEREGTALLTLNFLLGYGGKQETVSMARALARKVAAGELDPETIDFNMIESHLGVTKSPDLIIRTGGEMRLSNFLLLQSAYSEYFVSDKLWPAFQKEDLIEALEDYAKRRKLGGK